MPLKAEYRKRVRRFAPLKLRERNRLRGSIGDNERVSQYRSPIKKIAPARPIAGLESMSAKTIPPNPSTANRPPAQSNRRR